MVGLSGCVRSDTLILGEPFVCPLCSWNGQRVSHFVQYLLRLGANMDPIIQYFFQGYSKLWTNKILWPLAVAMLTLAGNKDTYTTDLVKLELGQEFRNAPHNVSAVDSN
jgi:hypothetical protein